MGNEQEPRGADNKRIEEHLGELETHSPPGSPAKLPGDEASEIWTDETIASMARAMGALNSDLDFEEIDPLTGFRDEWHRDIAEGTKVLFDEQDNEHSTKPR